MACRTRTAWALLTALVGLTASCTRQEEVGTREPAGARALACEGVCTHSELWLSHYDTQGDFEFVNALTASATRVHAASFSSAMGGEVIEGRVVTYDAATGRLLWNTSLGDIASQVATMSRDGKTVFVAGWDFGVAALDAASGAVLWRQAPGSTLSTPMSITVHPDGGLVFVTGHAYYSRTEVEYLTQAFQTSTGQKVWEHRYATGGGYDWAHALALSPDGTRLFVTGQSRAAATDMDILTLALDTAKGALLWARRFDGPASRWDSGRGIAVSPDGTRVFVTGGSAALTIDYVLLAYDAASGAQLWTQRHDSAKVGDNVPLGLVMDPGGARVYITGWADDVSWFNTGHIETVAYDAGSGVLLWVSTYGAASMGSAPRALGLSPDGARLYVTGSVTGGSSHAATVALDTATGATLWSAQYGDLRENEWPNALAVAPGGERLYVAVNRSYAGIPHRDDIATLAYPANALGPSVDLER